MKMFDYNCVKCGKPFQSTSNRAKYCEECRAAEQASRSRSYRKRKKSGNIEAVGGERICQVCGKPYTATSGFQKYCSECAKSQRQASKGQPNTKYLMEKYDWLRVNMPKGQKAQIEEYARTHDLSMSRLVLIALEEYMNNHE